MASGYIWDTKEKQSSEKPYGFVDFSSDFFKGYLSSRDLAMDRMIESYISSDPDPGHIAQIVQIAKRFPKYVCERLEEKLDLLNDNCTKEDRLRPVYSLDEIVRSDRFSASRMISTLYEKAYAGEMIDGVFMDHYKRLLKKAELRKLRAEYNSDFLNVSKEDISFKDKAYLAICLNLNSKPSELQSLSTSMKLNDLFASEANRLSPLSSLLAYVSLNLEREKILSIIAERGIDI